MKKVNKFCLVMNGLREAASNTKALKSPYSRLLQVDYNTWTGSIRSTFVNRNGDLRETFGTWRRIKVYDNVATMQEIALDIYKGVISK